MVKLAEVGSAPLFRIVLFYFHEQISNIRRVDVSYSSEIYTKGKLTAHSSLIFLTWRVCTAIATSLFIIHLQKVLTINLKVILKRPQCLQPYLT